MFDLNATLDVRFRRGAKKYVHTHILEGEMKMIHPPSEALSLFARWLGDPDTKN